MKKVLLFLGLLTLPIVVRAQECFTVDESYLDIPIESTETITITSLLDEDSEITYYDNSRNPNSITYSGGTSIPAGGSVTFSITGIEKGLFSIYLERNNSTIGCNITSITGRVVAKPSSADLVSLTINGVLIEGFSPDVLYYTYHYTYKSGVSIDLYAIADNPDASIEGYNQAVAPGCFKERNYLYVDVTAVNGNKKRYTVEYICDNYREVNSDVLGAQNNNVSTKKNDDKKEEDKNNSEDKEINEDEINESEVVETIGSITTTKVELVKNKPIKVPVKYLVFGGISAVIIGLIIAFRRKIVDFVRNNKKVLAIVIPCIIVFTLLGLFLPTVITSFKNRINNEEKPKENKIMYYCPEGYELKEEKCELLTYVSDAEKTTTCSEGYKLEGEECKKYEEIDAKTSYSCSNGYTLRGTECTKEVSEGLTKTIKCSSPYQQVGEECVVTREYELARVYYCTVGYLSGETCVQEYTSSPMIVNGRYNCGDSNCSLQGSTCYCRRTSPARLRLDCTRGSYDESLGKCTEVFKDTPVISYNCRSGFTKSGDKCAKTEKISANINKSCNNGYTLNNNRCIKLVDTKKSVIDMGCKDDLVLNDGKCYKLEKIDASIKE